MHSNVFTDMFSTQIFFFSSSVVTGQQRLQHTRWSPWCEGERGDGAPVNLSYNGTSSSCNVLWHLKVLPWPFNCALITFMSWGRQQPPNNPSSFMNSPLGHCPSRPSPGFLAAPDNPLLPVPQYVNGAAPVQQCHGAFCSGIWLLSHQPYWLRTGSLTQLEVSGCWGGEQSGLGGGQQPTRVRPHQHSVGIYKGSRHLSRPAGFGRSRLGFLPSQRLPALPALPKCFTAPTFFSNLRGPMW